MQPKRSAPLRAWEAVSEAVSAPPAAAALRATAAGAAAARPAGALPGEKAEVLRRGASFAA